MSKTLLSPSERMELLLGLHQAAASADLPDGFGLDTRHQEHDGHLIFEALHVLADGDPERLFAMLHSHSIKKHPNANPGRTYLYFRQVFENGIAGLTADPLATVA